MGTPSDDVICGLGGNDIIVGQAGDDEIRGGHGHDIVVGDSGADQIVGGPDTDLILGRGGEDVIYRGAGSDLVSGGGGNDDTYADRHAGVESSLGSSTRSNASTISSVMNRAYHDLPTWSLTSGVVPANREVSAGITRLFKEYGTYQAIAAQESAFHDDFVRTLTSAQQVYG